MRKCKGRVTGFINGESFAMEIVIVSKKIKNTCFQHRLPLHSDHKNLLQRQISALKCNAEMSLEYKHMRL